MKRFLLICMALVSTAAFACNGSLHEILHEVKTLSAEGYHTEARELFASQLKAGVTFNHQEDYLCYKSVRNYIFPDDSDIRLLCNGCDKPYYNDFPENCYACGSSSYRVAD